MLTPSQKSKVNQSSRSAIFTAYSSVTENWASQKWLQPQNKYISDPVAKIKDDKHNGKQPIYSHLRQYITASAMTHCMDGWGFIGRAIEAHLRGDSDVSRHLGYYAELRAAFSILASEGIGVFDRLHYIVNAKGKCELVPRANDDGTHKFTWAALDHWASTPRATDLLFSIIKPGGIPIYQWIDNFRLGSGMRSIVTEEWLRGWGMDLKMMAEDRDSRNFASYRPTAFTSPRALSIDETMKLVCDFWNVFEPSNSIRFSRLDRYLLKNSLEKYFKSSNPSKKSCKQASKLYRKQVADMLSYISPGDLNPDEWLNFLTDFTDTTYPIINDAKGTAKPIDPKHHKQVIARAALLLRVATGSCCDYIDTLTTTDKQNLQFWCSRIGEDRSLWQMGDEPDQFIDLWTDIKESLEEIDNWQTTPSNHPNSYFTLWKNSSDVVGMLGTCERIGLWGMGL
jgi:hypothetical protein